MINSQDFVDLYTRNYEMIVQQIDELTHEDSILQFPFESNSLNWILGHITVARCNVLAILGAPNTVWGFAQIKRFMPGSPPIRTADDAYPFEEIIAALGQTQTILVETLQKGVDLHQMKGDKTIHDHLSYYHFHEAYHIGQLEFCRQLVGKPSTGF
jgi:hypothetical protein